VVPMHRQRMPKLRPAAHAQAKNAQAAPCLQHGGGSAAGPHLREEVEVVQEPQGADGRGAGAPTQLPLQLLLDQTAQGTTAANMWWCQGGRFGWGVQGCGVRSGPVV